MFDFLKRVNWKFWNWRKINEYYSEQRAERLRDYEERQKELCEIRLIWKKEKKKSESPMKPCLVIKEMEFKAKTRFFDEDLLDYLLHGDHPYRVTMCGREIVCYDRDTFFDLSILIRGSLVGHQIYV